MPNDDAIKQLLETIDLIEQALDTADRNNLALVGAHLEMALISARAEIDNLQA